ncbi:MAG TPA: glycosyltransferase family 4 protein, partial [Actinomycetota bacterium]
MVAAMKALFVIHGHPNIRPGGAEGYAFELYEALRDKTDWDAVFLARADKPDLHASPRHSDAVIGSATSEPKQYLAYMGWQDFDWLFLRAKSKAKLNNEFRDFLLAHRPDVVHFQHLSSIGHEAIRVTRNTLPDAAIIFHLHEFNPICHHHGQMVRTERKNHQLCRMASPRRCHECFPGIDPAAFFARKRFLESQFRHVDRFIAPSHTVGDRFIDWGIPAEKVVFEEYGRLQKDPLPESERDGPRNRFAFFGQLTPFKGADVLLKAMAVLGEEFDGQLVLHGANLEQQHGDFKAKLKSLLEEAGDNVTDAGPYHHSMIPHLMAKIDWVIIPSIWWENSPLVIQEAFHHRRPVICSDIGGMAEKVTDGLNGLHFHRGDAEHLAATIRRAAETEGLWDELRKGIPELYSMDDHLSRM